MIASTPAPPYYAVIFTSLRSPADPEGYAATADRMVELAQQQPGYLGIESARGEEGLGITVSYWTSLEAIHAWREHAEHRLAQEHGRTKWYSRYSLRISRVERAWESDAQSRDQWSRSTGWAKRQVSGLEDASRC